MAAKRLHDQSDSDPDEQENKRIETDGASCISTYVFFDILFDLQLLYQVINCGITFGCRIGGVGMALTFH